MTVAPGWQRRGIGTEAVARVVAWLFAERGAHRVVAESDARNDAVAALLRRVGLRHEGRALDAEWWDGTWCSIDRWALLRQEWEDRAGPAGRPARTIAAPDVLVLNGTVGTGKTTTADAIGALLREAGVPHAVVDLDALRRSWPAPPDDPFNGRLLVRNLAAVVANVRAAGAERLVLAGVVETAEDHRQLAEAVGGSVVACRLVADPATLRARLLRRHEPGAERDWHLDRAGELDAVLRRVDLDDHRIDVGDDPPPVVAARVLAAIGWGPATTGR